MKALLAECSERLGHGVDRFPWSDRRAYADWLAQTYFYVRHSTRLLAAAAARFSHDERDTALHCRFAAHMAEEKKHELLCVHDLKVIGASLDSLPEHHSTRMFYEPQYYKIEHQAPIALFGYILPLEAIGPSHGKRILEPLLLAHGDKCAAFLKLHAAEDIDHLDKALELLDGLAGAERTLVEENMRQTTYAYVAMLEDIRRHLDLPSS
jgi:thiaminase